MFLFGDRKKLGINNTMDYYKYMLNMLRFGFHRTKLLLDNIRKDFYYEYAAFLSSNFETQKFGLSKLDFVNIQNLIMNISYLKYCEYFSRT